MTKEICQTTISSRDAAYREGKRFQRHRAQHRPIQLRKTGKELLIQRSDRIGIEPFIKSVIDVISINEMLPLVKIDIVILTDCQYYFRASTALARPPQSLFVVTPPH